MDQIYDRNPEELLGVPNTINNLNEAEAVHEAIIRYRTYLIFNDPRHIDTLPHYRGEYNFGWDISPGTFRSKGTQLTAAEGKVQEGLAAAEFGIVVTRELGAQALRCLFYDQRYGPQWDLLFQAQHAGIHTTILDFSFRWERGLYFAVEESGDPNIDQADGQYWAYLLPTRDLLNHGTFPTRDSYYNQDPQTLSPGKMINVPFFIDNIEQRVFEGRMYKQVGRFYVPDHRHCNIPLNHQAHIVPWLFRFRIPSAQKQVIREELAATGITRDYLYVEENPAHKALIADINQRICGW